MTSGDKESYSFITQIASAIVDMGETIRFRPHYITWYCAECKANNYTTSTADCISNGRYCAPDPDNSGPLNGSWVIWEDVKQLCVFRTWDRWVWLDYMDFANDCMQKDQEDIAACFENIIPNFYYDEVGTSKYNSCLGDSFAIWGNHSTDNNLLKQERESYTSFEISHWPSLFIDHAQYTGDLFPVENAAIAICEKVGPRNQVCEDIQSRLNQQNVQIEEISWGTIIGVSLLFAFIFALFMYYYRRVIRRDLSKEMSSQLHQMVSDYAAFTDKHSLVKRDASNI